MLPQESKNDYRDETCHDVLESPLEEEPSQTHRSMYDDLSQKPNHGEPQNVCINELDQSDQLFRGINFSPLDSPDSSISDSQPRPRDFKSDVHRLEQLLEKKDVTIQHLSEDLQQTRAILFQTRNELQASRKQSLKLKNRAFDIHQKFLRWDKMLQDWMAKNRGKHPQEWDARPGFCTAVTPTEKALAVTHPEPYGGRHGSSAEWIEEKHATGDVKQPTPTGVVTLGCNAIRKTMDHSATAHLSTSQKDVEPGPSYHIEIDQIPTTLNVSTPTPLSRTSTERSVTDLSAPIVNEMQPPLPLKPNHLAILEKGRILEDAAQSPNPLIRVVLKSNDSSRTSTPHDTTPAANILPSSSNEDSGSPAAPLLGKQEPRQHLGESTRQLFTSSHHTCHLESTSLTPPCFTSTTKATSFSEESDDDLLRDARILAQQRKTEYYKKQAMTINAEPDETSPLMVSFVDKENFNPNIQDPRRVTMTPKGNSGSSMSQNSDKTEGSPTELAHARHSVLREKTRLVSGSKPRDVVLPQRRLSVVDESAAAVLFKETKTETEQEKCDSSPSDSLSWNYGASSEALLARESMDNIGVQALSRTNVPESLLEKTKTHNAAVRNDPATAPNRSPAASTRYSVARALNGWRSNVMARTFVDEALGPQSFTEPVENHTKIINPYKKAQFKDNVQSPSVTESSTIVGPKSSTANKLSSSVWLDTTKASSKIMHDDDTSQVAYKHVEVIRGKKKRECLPGHSCQCCDPFWAAVCDGNDVFDRKQLQDCSRHRAAHSPESTPPNFWDLSFRDEVLARDGSGLTDKAPSARESTEI